LDWIEKEYGINRLLDELSSELRDGAYRPLPARRWRCQPELAPP
jgi:RNA-directed DNA polymerase